MAKQTKAQREREAGRDLGAELLEAARQMKAGQRAKEHLVTVSEIARIRHKTALSQPQFAHLLGISPRTLQGWEQGRRLPNAAARTLLKIADRHPEIIRELVSKAG